MELGKGSNSIFPSESIVHIVVNFVLSGELIYRKWD
jgi:hypothetical protein